MATGEIDFARLLGTAAQVHQAVGMICAQLEVAPEAAAMCLMTAADSEGSSLEDLAMEVVERRRRFTDLTEQ